MREPEMTKEFVNDMAHKWLDEIAQLRADLASVRQAQAWQPIETAPKDGTYVLLWEAGELMPGIFSYVDFGDAAPEGYHSGWYDNQTGRYEATHATHWMPLPAAPSADQEPSKEGR